jgi:hypothetical protein
VIVFDLKCSAHAHVFEAWFASSSSYDDQARCGLLACPICGDTEIAKAAMAPSVGTKANRRALMPVAKPAQGDGDTKAMLAAIAKVQAEMLAKSTWVGRDFDRRARAMDAGEIDQASIHGQVSASEARALVDDGIGVLPLPLPIVPPEQQN